MRELCNGLFKHRCLVKLYQHLHKLIERIFCETDRITDFYKHH